MPNKPYREPDPQTKASFIQWLERCAVRRCDPENQIVLLHCFGPMIRKNLRHFPHEPAKRLTDELFKPDIVRLGDIEKDRSRDNLIAFCDRVLYTVYSDQTSEMTRALKNHLLKLPSTVALHELSKFRFHALIKKTLELETLIAEAPNRPDRGKPSQKKEYKTTTNIDEPGLKFAHSNYEEFWCGNVDIPSVNLLLENPQFGNDFQKIMWFSKHKTQLMDYDEKNQTQLVKEFIGVGRSQYFKHFNNHIEKLRIWITEQLSDLQKEEKEEFFLRVQETIEQKLLREKAIPASWLKKIGLNPDNSPS